MAGAEHPHPQPHPHMTDQRAAIASETAVISDEQLQKAQEFIEEEEGAANKLAGWRAALITLLAVAVSLFHLYAAYGIVPAQVLRPVHVGVVLLLTFLLFPMLKRFRDRIMWWDIAVALLSIAAVSSMVMGGADLMDR